jgi:hypothetical protein
MTIAITRIVVAAFMGSVALTSIARGEGMSESQIRSTLDGYGMSNVKSLQREGDTYTGVALWHGKPVDLKVNAVTGRIEAPRRLDANQVKHLLEGKGYRNVHDIAPSEDAFVVAVEQREQAYRVVVDAHRGTILQQQAR